MAARVRVRVDSLRRAWRSSGYGEFWVELRTDHGTDADLGQAISDTADHFLAQGFGDARLNTSSASGFVVQVMDLASEEQLAAWFAELATRLERAGFAGDLIGVRQARSPSWYSGGYDDPTAGERIAYPAEPTAFIRWAIDLDAMTADPRRSSNWHVARDTTHVIVEHLANWTSYGGPEILLSHDTFAFRVADETSVASITEQAVNATGMTGILRYDPTREGGRAARTMPGGETVLQAISGTDDWRERIDNLRDAITALPALTDQAFIRPAPRRAIEWPAMQNKQPLQGITEIDVRYNPHVLDRYVPDAHGIQVLTDAHLANAANLSNWLVTGLGSRRHLVEAQDLSAWYASELPDTGVVEQARRDFGPMILTKNTIAANPTPWPR